MTTAAAVACWGVRQRRRQTAPEPRGRASKMATMPGLAPVPAPLDAWFTSVIGVHEPLRWEMLTLGTSNFTYRVTDGGREFILQRPPDVALDPTAHDVARQYRLLAAMHGTGAPVPVAVGACTETDVLGLPFMVVSFVPGHTLTTELPPDAPAPAQAAGEIGRAMVDALAAIHAVDWRSAGLDGFGRPDGFLERQVPRWTRYYERIAVRDLPLVEELAAWLDAHRPVTIEPTIMHGDFHLANCLVTFDDPARVRAVIDWEMATIGDPLVDLAGMLFYWGTDRPAIPALPRSQAVSRVLGSPSRIELAERYAQATGRAIEALQYYLVLAGWKLATVMESAYANYTHGRTTSPVAKAMEHDVPRLLAEAAAFAEADRPC
jgi:aminoglycoside phosphotransferase (APT) family kinase protein